MIVFSYILQYHFLFYTIQRFCGSLMQNGKRNSLMANDGKTSANEEIWRYRKREFNRGTNRAGMFLPVPLFTLGFAPLAMDVHTDGQFLCKRKRQPRRVLHDKTGICKILRRTQFLVLHARVFHLPRCFTLRILAETRLFPHCFILPWCRLNAWTRCHQQWVKLVLRISLQTSYEWPKI